MNHNILREMRLSDTVAEVTPKADQHLQQSRTIYCGYDATASSLAVGNLATLVGLGKLARAGHEIILLVGGATTLIGDPSGRLEERPILEQEKVEINKAKIIEQLKKYGELCSEKPVKIVDNKDWYEPMTLLDYMQNIAARVRLPRLASLDSVKNRESRTTEGLTLKELMYSTLQGYDFVHLNRNYDCTVQFAGVDQWGNITSGIQLSDHSVSGELHAITIPLVCDEKGNKFGKSDQVPILLDENATSPFSFHQFFLQQPDSMVNKLLRAYTFRTHEEIQQIISEHKVDPSLRLAQKALADSVTKLVHGEVGLEIAKSSAKMFFGGELGSVDLNMFDQLCRDNVIGYETTREISLDRLLVSTTLATSLNRAREFLRNGAITINGRKVSVDTDLNKIKLMDGKYAILKRGKKMVRAVKYV